jgi:ParB family chromosome partitioning protein
MLHDVTGLAKNIDEIGLLNPITLTEDHVLVAGLHRLNACKKLGWKTIPYTTISVDELDQELAELSENFFTHKLSALEESAHVARMEQIAEAKGERAKGGFHGNRFVGPDTVSGPTKTTDQRAAELDMSGRTYRRRRAVGHGLTPEVKDLISGIDDPDREKLPNKPVELMKLTKHTDPEEQYAVASIIAEGKASTVAKAEKELHALGKEESNTDSDVEEEAEEEGAEKITKIVRFRNVPEYIVEYADEARHTVPRATVLKRGWRKCKECNGHGVLHRD